MQRLLKLTTLTLLLLTFISCTKSSEVQLKLTDFQKNKTEENFVVVDLVGTDCYLNITKTGKSLSFDIPIKICTNSELLDQEIVSVSDESSLPVNSLDSCRLFSDNDIESQKSWFKKFDMNVLENYQVNRNESGEIISYVYNIVGVLPTDKVNYEEILDSYFANVYSEKTPFEYTVFEGKF
jgi:hypothetical protein